MVDCWLAMISFRFLIWMVLAAIESPISEKLGFKISWNFFTIWGSLRAPRRWTLNVESSKAVPSVDFSHGSLVFHRQQSLCWIVMGHWVPICRCHSDQNSVAKYILFTHKRWAISVHNKFTFTIHESSLRCLLIPRWQEPMGKGAKLGFIWSTCCLLPTGALFLSSSRNNNNNNIYIYTYTYIHTYICIYIIYIYISMDCVCQRYHKECSTRTCADDCYNWGNHDVRDASFVCGLSQFLTAWRLVLPMKPWSYIWLEFGLFSTIIYIYIYTGSFVQYWWSCTPSQSMVSPIQLCLALW